MTHYELGFLTYCADHGVDGRHLLQKRADADRSEKAPAASALSMMDPKNIAARIADNARYAGYWTELAVPRLLNRSRRFLIENGLLNASSDTVKREADNLRWQTSIVQRQLEEEWLRTHKTRLPYEKSWEMASRIVLDQPIPNTDFKEYGFRSARPSKKEPGKWTSGVVKSDYTGSRTGESFTFDDPDTATAFRRAALYQSEGDEARANGRWWATSAPGRLLGSKAVPFRTFAAVYQDPYTGKYSFKGVPELTTVKDDEGNERLTTMPPQDYYTRLGYPRLGGAIGGAAPFVHPALFYMRAGGEFLDSIQTGNYGRAVGDLAGLFAPKILSSKVPAYQTWLTKAMGENAMRKFTVGSLGNILPYMATSTAGSVADALLQGERGSSAYRSFYAPALDEAIRADEGLAAKNSVDEARRLHGANSPEALKAEDELYRQYRAGRFATPNYFTSDEFSW